MLGLSGFDIAQKAHIMPLFKATYPCNHGDTTNRWLHESVYVSGGPLANIGAIPQQSWSC